MSKPQPETRLRTCRACGKQYEYPLKGSDASRHHCEECVPLPADVRLIIERLTARITTLERQLKQLQPKPASPPATPAPPPKASTPA